MRVKPEGAWGLGKFGYLNEGHICTWFWGKFYVASRFVASNHCSFAASCAAKDQSPSKAQDGFQVNSVKNKTLLFFQSLAVRELVERTSKHRTHSKGGGLVTCIGSRLCFPADSKK